MELEQQLTNWTAPSSTTEQDKQDRTERMVREAIAAHEPFDDCALKIYAKGSYANNTNVRADSDVDIAVECTECIYWREESPGAHPSSTVYSGIWTPQKLRTELAAALEAKFPGEVDTSGSVAIQVNASSARMDADVVPSFSFEYHFNDGTVRKGTKIFPKNGSAFENYPQQHLDSGQAKNNATSQRFKKAVRILKRVENAMLEEGVHDEVPSYFVECLVYNCPNELFTRSTWVSRVKGIIYHIWDGLDGEEPTDSDERWLEVNQCKWLFTHQQKWSREEGRAFAKAAWNHLELGE